jgi:hypothetical protein
MEWSVKNHKEALMKYIYSKNDYVFLLLRSVFFWGITQHWMVIPYWLWGQHISPIFQGQEVQEETWATGLFKMGLICCPEMLAKDYHSTLCNTPEKCRSHQHHGGSLKSWIFLRLSVFCETFYMLGNGISLTGFCKMLYCWCTFILLYHIINKVILLYCKECILLM